MHLSKHATGKRMTSMSTFTRNQIALIAAPPVLLLTTYLTFKVMGAWLGPKRGYLAGFLFYWVCWCILFPLWAVGPDGLRNMFKAARPPFGEPGWLGFIFIVLPVVASFVALSPAKFREATLPVIAISVLFSLVNGTMEEVLWRGTYITAFPDSWFWSVIYTSIGFGLWHLSPAMIYPNEMPGGSLAFAVMAIFLGLPFGWVAKQTGSIRWVVISHILLDFPGLAGFSF